MKKQLKLMSLLLSIIMLLITATPISANAFEIIADDNATLITPSERAIYSIYGNAAPIDLCKELSDLNVLVESNTLIEIVPMESGSGTSLVITNVVDSNIIKDFIVAPQSTGTFANITLVPSETFSVRETKDVYFPDFSDSLIHATVTYDFYVGSYYRPLSVQFVYTSNGSDIITNVDVRYICEGFVFTYPGLEDLSTDDFDIYSHEMVLFKAAPVSGVPYSFSRPYRSDRVISIGAPQTSHHINFILYINGERLDGTQLVR